MNNILYIRANCRDSSTSTTTKIASSFIEEYLKNNPEDKITTLDLYKEEIDFLRENNLKDMESNEINNINHPVFKYAYQFLNADKYIIDAPFWNLSFPAILKAYIDYVTVSGITFKYTETMAVGLCKNKKAVHVVSRGGFYSTGPAANYEMGDKYLRTLFGFLGIEDFTTIAAENLDMIGADKESITQNSIEVAQRVAKSF